MMNSDIAGCCVAIDLGNGQQETECTIGSLVVVLFYCYKDRVSSWDFENIYVI